VTADFPKMSPLFCHPTTEFRQSFESMPKQKSYSTHAPENSKYATIHQIAQVISTPWKEMTKCLGRVLEPLPGENKEHKLWGKVVQIVNLVAFFILLPFGFASLLIAFPIHLMSLRARPYISVIDNSENVAPHKSKAELDLRTYNVGFIYDAMCLATDLRPVAVRAAEIVKAFNEEENSPDVICFQEMFSLEGTRIISEGLKHKFPYIIHSVGPHASGLNSGLMIASKYPVEEVTFRRFNNLLGVEKLSSKGLLSVRLDLGEGRYANVYDAHTQALLGKEKSQTRFNQFKQIVEWMDIDDTRDQLLRGYKVKVGDFLMGDLNISLIDAWGNANPLESAGMRFLRKHFYDPFHEEHDLQGNRIKGKARFLKSGRTEPTGSWHIGPASTKPLFLRISEWVDSFFNGVKKGKNIKPLENPVSWGTRKWKRTANTARFDYQLVRKRLGHVKGIAETEHVPNNAQSGPSDHLPHRAVYQINNLPKLIPYP
jgi:exonuclease III